MRRDLWAIKNPACAGLWLLLEVGVSDQPDAVADGADDEDVVDEFEFLHGSLLKGKPGFPGSRGV